MNRRRFLRMIRQHGWMLDRADGAHDVYRKGRESLAVPRHREISAGVVRQWDEKNRRADEEGDD